MQTNRAVEVKTAQIITATLEYVLDRSKCILTEPIKYAGFDEPNDRGEGTLGCALWGQRGVESTTKTCVTGVRPVCRLDNEQS
eukprot:CAMPEP_0118936376 /NCGR_PEP_ID=MMETSP1169-20130426/18558_1 /TAXON_ID=36882 /ORGANISM="Pyramimonas obovata, Strain CCMP722" /LENGTH=82 /DNA_ID=CAMNT_0006879611 /DNA_START=139 /DNA_END=387 /DNA_ORIENTATION=-